MSKIKVQTETVVNVGGRRYKTADAAARAWAERVFWKFQARHAQKIGKAAYHDAAWEARNGRDPQYDQDFTDVGAPGLVMNFSPNRLEARAYRRSMPIFRRILGR